MYQVALGWNGKMMQIGKDFAVLLKQVEPGITLFIAGLNLSFNCTHKMNEQKLKAVRVEQESMSVQPT